MEAAQVQAPIEPGITPPLGRVRAGASLGEALASLGFAADADLQLAEATAERDGRSIEDVLIDDNVVNPDQLARAVAERYGLDHVDLTTYHVDMAAASLVPVGLARRYRAVPIGFDEQRRLILAMADPSNVLAVDDVQMLSGHQCRVTVASRAEVDSLIGRLGVFETSIGEADEYDALEESTAISEMRESAEDAPVIKLVHSVIAQAVAEGASDIHFEPSDGEMRVRFRVDGVMHEATTVPRRMVAGVVSRVKIMASLDIAEKRLPQDGRFGLQIEQRKVDIRVVTLPTGRGEGCVLRILDKSGVLLELDRLGISGTAAERLRSALHKPYGAIFSTGPTGSGKTTTLYSALRELNQVERNIITIEDPVEYQIAGISQIGVNSKVGLSFATGLRSILRADPDVIMVGEIRDADTARIAVEAALTGHLVLSTLHTKSAPTAVTRLTEMGVEPFLTASSLDCVVAQRLARTLCTACKRSETISAEAMIENGFAVTEDVEVYEPGGCAACGQTGYRGRLGLFEVMAVTDELRSLIVESSSSSEIARLAREQGMRTLREDGLEKVQRGLTSVEEVARVSS